MDIFLRAKHWQLFLLTFGIPVLLQIALMFSIFASLINNPNPDPSIIFSHLKFLPVIILLFSAGLYGWQFAVATGLQKMVPAEVKMKVTRFKIFFFMPVIYLILLLIFIFVIVINFSHIDPSRIDPSDFGLKLFISFALIIPIHMLAMGCIFYCIYFIAKTLKTVELQRDVSFSDFVGEFFLVWFFPVGVWILQPRINRMAANYAEPVQPQI